MKKLFLAALVLICLSFCTKEYSREDLKEPVSYSTTWAGTSALQGVTLAALGDAVSGSILFQSTPTSIPSTLELVTKAKLATYNIIDYGDIIISGKSSVQVLIKSDFMVIKIDVSAGQSSCGGTTFTQVLYATSATITTGVYLYTNKERTTPYVGDGSSWYGFCSRADNACSSQAIKINSSGLITDSFAC